MNAKKCGWKRLIILASLVAGCAAPVYAPLATVESVDLNRYGGRWYEVAMLPNKFQSMCASDTQANYVLDGDAVRVTNRCRKTDGNVEEANGRANVVEGSRNARLRVTFFWPFYGDYWVLALDPDYKWVLIGEPSRKYGWILSRSPQLADKQLDEILTIAALRGFNRNAFTRTSQLKPIP